MAIYAQCAAVARLSSRVTSTERISNCSHHRRTVSSAWMDPYKQLLWLCCCLRSAPSPLPAAWHLRAALECVCPVSRLPARHTHCHIDTLITHASTAPQHSRLRARRHHKHFRHSSSPHGAILPRALSATSSRCNRLGREDGLSGAAPVGGGAKLIYGNIRGRRFVNSAGTKTGNSAGGNSAGGNPAAGLNKNTFINGQPSPGEPKYLLRRT